MLLCWTRSVNNGVRQEAHSPTNLTNESFSYGKYPVSPRRSVAVRVLADASRRPGRAGAATGANVVATALCRRASVGNATRRPGRAGRLQ